MMMDKIPILKRRAEQQQSTAASNSDATNCKSDDKTNNTSSTASINTNNAKDPICVIVVGMAGSGKTTLMAQLQKSLNLKARAEKEDDNKKSSSADDNDVSLCYVCVVVMCIWYVLYCVCLYPYIDILMSLCPLHICSSSVCTLVCHNSFIYMYRTKKHQYQMKGQGMQ